METFDHGIFQGCFEKKRHQERFSALVTLLLIWKRER